MPVAKLKELDVTKDKAQRMYHMWDKEHTWKKIEYDG